MAAENFNPTFNPEGAVAENLTITSTNGSDELKGGFGHDSLYGLGGVECS